MSGPLFTARREPPDAAIAAVARLAPANPFLTVAYVKARQSLAVVPWVLALEQGGQPDTACVAFQSRGQLASTLELPSLPALPDPSPFWTGVRGLCREQGISHLKVQTFASPPTTVPRLPGEIARRQRQEFVIDLGSPQPWAALSPKHAASIRRARSSGLTIRRAADEAARAEHQRLVDASLARRDAKGGDGDRFIEAALRTGAAALFQAERSGQTLSSAVVLLAPRGAYYYSAGTSPEGRALGASHLLIQAVAEEMRGGAIEEFNLGGATPEQEGLIRFKTRFGSRVLHLESAEFFVGGWFLRGVQGLGRLLRR